jgi:hypothetical protein
MISRHDAVEKVKGKLQRANSLRTKCRATKAKLEYENVGANIVLITKCLICNLFVKKTLMLYNRLE